VTTNTRETDTTTWLLEELALVWASFEIQLSRVPIVSRIETHTATIDDYRNLLLNLCQQVAVRARWITRAASNLTADHARRCSPPSSRGGGCGGGRRRCFRRPRGLRTSSRALPMHHDIGSRNCRPWSRHTEPTGRWRS
jgi:hypothetical protein